MNRKLVGALAAALTLAACSSQADTASAPAPTPAAPSATSSAAGASPTTAPSDTPAAASPAAPPAAGETPIRLTVGDQTFDALLNDTQVSQDFLETCPGHCRGSATAASSTSPSSTRP